jgi:hypothetical protein
MGAEQSDAHGKQALDALAPMTSTPETIDPIAATGYFEVALAQPGSLDLLLSGWARAEVSEIAAVELMNGAGDVLRAEHGLPRPDVAEFLAQPEAVNTGWELRIPSASAWHGVVHARVVLARGDVTEIGSRAILPFVASIDAPAEGEDASDGVAMTSGWAIGIHTGVVAIRVLIGEQEVAVLPLTKSRPDLREVFPGIGPEPCAFYGLVPLPSSPSSTLSFVAVLDDGTEHPVAERTVRRLDLQPLAKAPLARLQGAFRAVARATRAGDWWLHKIGFLVGIAAAEAAIHRLPFAESAPRLATLVVAGSSLAAFGHVVNESFDVESDRLAGKANQMAHRSWPYRLALMLVLLAGGWVPCLVSGVDGRALAFWAALTLMLIVYSVPPIRLKDRSWGGVIADALYGQTLPVGFVSYLMRNPTTDATTLTFERWWTFLLLVWAATFGLHGILMHQLSDREADLRSGTGTFAAKRSEAQVWRIIRRLLMPLELAAFCGLAVLAWRVAPTAVVLVASATLLELLTRRFDELSAGPWDVPRVLVYCLLLPLAFGVQLVLVDRAYVVFCVLFALAFLPALRHQLVTYRRTATVLLQRLRGNG